MLTDKGVIKAGAGATAMCQGSEAEIPEVQLEQMKER